MKIFAPKISHKFGINPKAKKDKGSFIFYEAVAFLAITPNKTLLSPSQKKDTQHQSYLNEDSESKPCLLDFRLRGWLERATTATANFYDNDSSAKA